MECKNLNVKVIQLPSYTVASCHVIGKEPEKSVGELVDKFIRDSKLYEIKQDSRYFGFNHPSPGILDDGTHGYEVWVTIPEDMEISRPMVKKQFPGGLYASLTIKFPDFYRWAEISTWAANCNEYEVNNSELGPENMFGALEEHLNWIYYAHSECIDKRDEGELNLLLPIKKKMNHQ